MTERFERIVIVILGTFVIILGVWFYYSVYRMQNDRIEILGYQSQIELLQMESEEQERRFEDSRKRANYEMRRIQNESQKILSEKVPKDCKKAMQWGLNEARNFR